MQKFRLTFIPHLSLVIILIIISTILFLNSNHNKPTIVEPNQEQKGEVKEDVSTKSKTDIDEPVEIKLSSFAPFYYWKKSSDNKLVLTQYTTEKENIVYESITKSSKTYLDSQDIGIFDEIVSPNKKYLAFSSNVNDGNLFYSVVEIFNTDTKKVKIYRIPTKATNLIAGSVVIYSSSWSPNNQHFYFLHSSDLESEHNIWVIDVDNESIKKLLSGYSIHVLGWLNGDNLAYYEFPANNSKNLDIFSIDVRDHTKEKIGYCDQFWLIRCLSAKYFELEESVLYLDNPNTTNIYAYNFKNQSALLLNNILYEEEFTHASIRGISPNNKYMYFHILQNYTQNQPEKGGMYEYNLIGNYFRHISRDDYGLIMWDRYSDSVLLKGKGVNSNSYFIHRVESYNVNPVIIPEDIVQIIG